MHSLKLEVWNATDEWYELNVAEKWPFWDPREKFGLKRLQKCQNKLGKFVFAQYQFDQATSINQNNFYKGHFHDDY